MLTNDETGSAFTLEKSGDWCYVYRGEQWGIYGLSILDITTGELIRIRESVGEFFIRCTSADWWMPRLVVLEYPALRDL